MNHRSHLGKGGGIPSLLNQPICVLKGKYFFSKMHCAYLALGLLLLPAVTLIMCYKWWHTKQTGLQAHVIVLYYQSDNQKEQELWLLNWSISRFCVADIIIYIQKWGLNIFNIFPAGVRTLLGLPYADSWGKVQHKTCLKFCFHRLKQAKQWLLMKLIQVYTSNLTSVNAGISSDVNWHHSLSKSVPTLSGATEIPPVIYTCDKKPWLSGSAWRFSRSNADISIGVHGWNKLVKSTAESESGPLGQYNCGESLSANIQEILSPSSATARSVTLLFHNDFGGPGASSLYVWMGGRLPQA